MKEAVNIKFILVYKKVFIRTKYMIEKIQRGKYTR